MSNSKAKLTIRALSIDDHGVGAAAPPGAQSTHRPGRGAHHYSRDFSSGFDNETQGVVSRIGEIALQRRKYGVGLLVINQRTALVGKTILSQCNTFLTHSLIDQTSLDFLESVYIDIFSTDEMDGDPTFHEFLRPRGLGWAAGTVVQVPSEDMLAFSIERRFADGPVEDQHLPTLNALRPHLARAAFMSARLRLGRAQGMAESLNRMGLPSAVLLGDGKVIATSPLFETLGGQVISRAFGRVALADAGANALLAEAIQNLNSPKYQFGAKSIPVPAKGENAAVIVHLIPVRRSAHDIFGPAMGILVVTPLGSSQSLPDELLNGLFDLSPAEIRAANGCFRAKPSTISRRARGCPERPSEPRSKRFWPRPDRQGNPTSFRCWRM